MKRGFTLVELLIVVGVTIVISSLVGSFFADGWVAGHRALRRVDDNESILLIMKSWQKSLAGTRPAAWRVENDVLTAGHTSARQDGRHLLLAVDGREKRLLLPQGAACEFSVESGEGLARCAVMNLRWESPFFRTQQTNHVRLVACGQKGASLE